MELKKCLVCCKDCLCLPETVSAKESNRKGSAETEKHIPYNQQDGEIGTVKNQLQIIFLLRKMLEIPEDTCCKLLEHFGNPNLWVQCCDSCAALVDKSQNIFDQIISLQKNYEELRMNIKNTIMTSQNYFGNDYKCEAIVRSYVITQDVDYFIKTVVNETEGLNQELQPSNPIVKPDELLVVPNHSGKQCLRTENGPTGNLISEATITIEPEKVMSLGENKEGEKLTGKNFKNKMFSKEMHIPSLPEGQKQNSQENATRSTSSSIMKLRPHRVKTEEENNSKEESPLSHDENHSEDETCELKPTRTNECPKCNRTLSSSTALRFHMVTHSKRRPHTCDICGKGFKLPQTLKYHRMTHTGEKPYECETCGKLFRMNKMLNVHRLTHLTHTGDKPHECDICGKLFAMKQALTFHRRIHTGEKPHECDFCGKLLSTPQSLKQHRMIHTGEKPYNCDICGKSFTLKRTLINHRSIHTGEKPFECDICGKAFSLNQTLKFHRMTHTGEKPFECGICGKQFRINKTLKNHRMAHTGEKPNQCDICEKSFIMKQSLKHHRMTHLKGTSFECDICGKSFKAKLSLNHHYESHTKEILETYVEETNTS